MENTIKLKHWIKKEVYFVSQRDVPHYINCTLCEGEGILLAKSGRCCTCTECKGEKKISNGGSTEFFVESSTINNITVDIDSYGTITLLYFLKTGHCYNEEDLLDTKEEVEICLMKIC